MELLVGGLVIIGLAWFAGNELDKWLKSVKLAQHEEIMRERGE